MKALVVFHTKYGNCKKIAENIAEGMKEVGIEVEITDSDARGISAECDIVAVGSGTRMGKMTGAIKRFIKREIKQDAWAGKPFLAFGTGGKPKGTGEKHDDWNCRGAIRIYEALEERGLKPLREPAQFFIKEEQLKGPLREGEEERARQVGLEVGRKLL